MTSISLEDTLEWAKKQLRVAHNNYDRVKDRHYDPEQLNDLRKKIGHLFGILYVAFGLANTNPN